MDIKRNKKAYKGEEWVVREYYKTDKDSVQRYKKEFENDLRQNRVNDMADLEKIIMSTTERILKKKYKYKRKKAGG